MTAGILMALRGIVKREEKIFLGAKGRWQIAPPRWVLTPRVSTRGS